ncbi:MAG TPA: ammonium transporter [Solirubrobacteraceae bacterium]|nr:ammonium transporter [Solirubrobacteraceae bacterium]
MSRRTLSWSAVLGMAALLALPALAAANSQDLEAAEAGKLAESVGINSMWVVVAAVLVIFMQAGFAFLEIGFSRGKNVGTVVAKILTNFSIAAICFWAVGFAIAFGVHDAFGIDGLWGTDGFFLTDYFGHPSPDPGVIPPDGGQAAFPVMGLSDATVEAKFLFQFAFCAVSLAIVWGTTLERIKFGVYIIYAIVFASLIYPLAAGWVFGGGFLQTGDWLGTGIAGMQDFAGSTAVHLIGATGALAVLLLLGPRRGKYGPDGKPRAIPGHSMPIFGLGVIILLIGWFGFNPGSTLGALDGRFTEVAAVTLLAAAAGVIFAVITAAWKTKTIDIGMAGNGMIGALVAITAPSGYVELWAAPIIGAVAGIIVPLGVYAIDKYIDDPVGALTAHGLCGVWGTLACGLFTAPRLAQYNAFGNPDGGLFYSGSFAQLIAQAAGILIVFTFVFSMSYGTFWLIKKVYGLRVSDEEEEAGLDITEHGMYGYPEQFIPAPELIGYATSPGSRDVPAPQVTPEEVTT